MDSDSPPMDPRYRPEFQRGYVGDAAPTPVVPTKSADEPIRAAIPPAGVIAVESATAADPPPTATEPVRRRLNPYIALIVALGVAALGLGTWLTVRQSFFAFDSNGSSIDSQASRFGQILTYTFAGPLVTVGIATLLGLGFFIAARRR